MPDLRIDGVEVRFSNLHHRAFKAAPCEVLLPVTADNRDVALARFASEGAFGEYSGLRVSGIADLGFLQDFPDLRYLEVVDRKRVDPRPLNGSSNLRGLGIESPGAGIDFSWFPELEVFRGDWHVDNVNIDRCRELRTLGLGNFEPRSSDLTGLAGATRLETLEITRTNLSSLAGVEALEDLRYLDMTHAPKLESLEAFSVGDCGIREFSLRKAGKVASYGPIASLKRLRRLRLSACAPMSDLQWTAGMNHLDEFSFVETNVVDGDLSPLLELPSLRYVGTMDKKHYNHKFERLNEILDERTR